jgi:hypothetical protein
MPKLVAVGLYQNKKSRVCQMCLVVYLIITAIPSFSIHLFNSLFFCVVIVTGMAKGDDLILHERRAT